MSVFVRYLKRVLLMLALLTAVTIVAGVIYVRTNSFARFFKGQVSNLLATSFRGEITLDKIDTSSWGALIIHELNIRSGGATVVRIRQIQLGYSLIPLLWHEARIEITAVDPAINLQRESDGEWNLMKALASKSPTAASSGSTAFAIYLDKLGVRNAAVDLAPRGASGCDLLRGPLPNVIPAAAFHAKYDDVVISPDVEILLHGFVNTVRIADDDRQPLVKDVVNAALHVLVQTRETPRPCDKHLRFAVHNRHLVRVKPSA